MKKHFVFLLVLFLVWIPFSVAAQDDSEPLVLGLIKDFGYAAAGQIQGSFTLVVRSPDDLVSVEFFIDGQLVHTSTEPPFRFKFNTADFEPGRHTFSAIGYRADQSTVSSSEFSRQFISAEDAWSNVEKLIVPVFVVIGVVTLMGTLGGGLLGRKSEFVLGKYGLAGGAVCPRCQLPYSRHVLAPNLLVGKLQRCPHCDKWAIVPQASPQNLRAAEGRYQSQESGDSNSIEQETDYRDLLDDSRFEH